MIQDYLILSVLLPGSRSLINLLAVDILSQALVWVNYLASVILSNSPLVLLLEISKLLLASARCHWCRWASLDPGHHSHSQNGGDAAYSPFWPCMDSVWSGRPHPTLRGMPSPAYQVSGLPLSLLHIVYQTLERSSTSKYSTHYQGNLYGKTITWSKGHNPVTQWELLTAKQSVNYTMSFCFICFPFLQGKYDNVIISVGAKSTKVPGNVSSIHSHLQGFERDWVQLGGLCPCEKLPFVLLKAIIFWAQQSLRVSTA